jgi:small-conductance mechanosensitive channel
MEDALDRLLAAAVLFAPRFFASLAILAAFWVMASVAQGVIGRLAGLRRIHAQAITVLQQSVRLAILSVGVVTALGTSGFNVMGLVAGLGLTGFALGFALKDVLANVVAGVLILSYRPFRPDDRVSVAGYEGVVTNIDMRYTTLTTEDRRVLVPNSTVLTNAVSVFAE